MSKKIPTYGEAVHWLTTNDDTSWVSDSYLSVTAHLVADLFGVEPARLREDVRLEIVKARAA